MSMLKNTSQKIEKRKDGSRRCVQVSEAPTMTKQSFKDECDPKSIMKRFEKTGQITHLNPRQPFYGDVTGVPSFQVLSGVAANFQAYFETLPEKLRKRFGNDPRDFFQYFTNPENKEEGIRLGVLKPEKKKGEEGAVPPPQQAAVKQETVPPKDGGAGSAKGS